MCRNNDRYKFGERGIEDGVPMTKVWNDEMDRFRITIFRNEAVGINWVHHAMEHGISQVPSFLSFFHVADACWLASGADARIVTRALFERSKLVRAPRVDVRPM